MILTADIERRAGPGRPRLPPDRVLCHEVRVAVDDETLDWLIKRAGVYQSLSSYVRALIQECKRRQE